jgi:hypothetical protein
MYLNFATGAGSGMDYAIQNGLVDPTVMGPGGPPFDPTIEVITPLGEVVQSAVDSVKRKDKFLFPLNTDFDLFSIGPNGLTKPSLGEAWSLDDVIRANDGGYFGLAANY